MVQLVIGTTWDTWGPNKTTTCFKGALKKARVPCSWCNREYWFWKTQEVFSEGAEEKWSFEIDAICNLDCQKSSIKNIGALKKLCPKKKHGFIESGAPGYLFF